MRRWLLLSILLTALAGAGSLYVYLVEYDHLPPEVPVHWDINFEPDGWASRDTALWICPAGMAALVVLTVLLPWLSPRHFDVDRFRGTYEYVMALLVALLGYLHLGMLWGALARDFPLGRFLVAGFFLFFALMGNVVGKVRRNFWMGVRTPWTLASEAVWNQTHRLAAWLLVAGSLVGLAAVLLGAPLAWCFVGLMLVLAVPVVYSLVLYKRLEKQGRL
jgi:uncharacterized membrane protein